MSTKSFKDNPALLFITPESKTAQETKTPAVATTPRPTQQRQPTPVKKVEKPASQKRRVAIPDHGPAFEAKSKRLNLLIRPSLFGQLAEIAKQKGLSNNDLIHQVLEQAIVSGSIQNI